MKAFNLEEALVGKPVVTRDGRKVTELYLFKTANSNYPLRVCIDKDIKDYTDRGTYYAKDTTSEHDLFMEVPIIESWVNVYCSNGYIYLSSSYESKEEAIEGYRNGPDTIYYVKTIKINNKPE